MSIARSHTETILEQMDLRIVHLVLVGTNAPEFSFGSTWLSFVARKRIAGAKLRAEAA